MIQMDRINPKGVNGVIKAQTLPGATADVQIAAGFALGDIVDVRGYKATTQTIAATVVINSNQTLICDPATTFVPSGNAIDMFSIKANAHLIGCNVSVPGNVYTGKVFKFDDNYGNANNTLLDEFTIQASTNTSGGYGVYMGSTNISQTIAFVTVRRGRIFGMNSGLYLTATGVNSWVNGNHFEDIEITGTPYGTYLNATHASGHVDGNLFVNYSYEFGSATVASIYDPSTGGGSSFNVFNSVAIWDGCPVNFSGASAHRNFVIGNVNGTWTDTNGDNYLIDAFQGRFILGQAYFPIGLITKNNAPLLGYNAAGNATYALAQVAPSNVVAIGDATTGLFFSGTSFNTNGSGAINAGSNPATLKTATLTAAAPTVSAGQVGLGSTTATSATAGANGAVPAQVAQYLIVNIAGTNFKIPVFNV